LLLSLIEAGWLVFTGSDSSPEGLVSYLEGATARRWDSIQFNNGVPQRYKKCFDNEDIHSVPSEELHAVRLLRDTDIYLHLPPSVRINSLYLLSTVK
jgi:hypothetical protein